MSQLLKTGSAATQNPDDYLAAVFSAGSAACEHGLTNDIEVAGKRVRFRFSSPALQSQLFRALRHVEVSRSDSDAFEVVAWSSNDPGLILDGSPWEARQHWESGRILSVRSERGYVFCNPHLATACFYDRWTQRGAFWVPNEGEIQNCVGGAPFLNLLNWWLAENDLALCHAAAFGLRNAAVLVVGRGGAGKSTTAFASLATRLRYVSDDYTVVSVGDAPKVYSLYNSGKLYVDQLRQQFPELDHPTARPRPTGDEEQILFFGETHPEKLLLQAPLKAILVPEITRQTSPTMEGISASRAMRAFGPNNVLQLPGNQRLKLSMLAAVTRALPAYRIRLCPDLAKNLELIQSILGE